MSACHLPRKSSSRWIWCWLLKIFITASTLALIHCLRCIQLSTFLRPEAEKIVLGSNFRSCRLPTCRGETNILYPRTDYWKESLMFQYRFGEKTYRFTGSIIKGSCGQRNAKYKHDTSSISIGPTQEMSDGRTFGKSRIELPINDKWRILVRCILQTNQTPEQIQPVFKCPDSDCSRGIRWHSGWREVCVYWRCEYSRWAVYACCLTPVK